MALVLLAVIVIRVAVFTLAEVSADPTPVLLPHEASEEQIADTRAERSLDRPLHVQYWVWVNRLVRGDLGNSFKWAYTPASELMIERLPGTLELSLFALPISSLIASPIGVLVAVKEDSAYDYAGKIFAIWDNRHLPSPSA